MTSNANPTNKAATPAQTLAVLQSLQVALAKQVEEGIITAEQALAAFTLFAKHNA